MSKIDMHRQNIKAHMQRSI